MNRIFTGGLSFVLIASMVAAAESTNFHVAARIDSANAWVMNEKYPEGLTSFTRLHASCVYSFNTMKARVKKPILKLIVCGQCADGVRFLDEFYAVSRENIWGWSRTCDGIETARQRDMKSRRSGLNQRNALGENRDEARARRRNAATDPVLVSQLEAEVESGCLRRVSVKNGDWEKDGEMMRGWVKGSKVIAFRTELWFDGAMLCCLNNPQITITLSRLKLPEDWYVKGKYPDKIKYSTDGDNMYW